MVEHPGSETVDYQLHNLVAIRLVAAPRDALETLQREVGPLLRSPSATPDLVIRFVDALPATEDTRLLGLDEAAYDNDAFYLLDPRGRRTRIPLERFGEPCEIVCERGVHHIPLVREAIGLRLLAQGNVLLHSAAFTFEGNTVLVAGWQKGGKSELLLSFMSSGATFISDEWTIVRPETRMLMGFGDRLFVWDWHLAQLPALRARLRPRERARLRLLDAYRTAYRMLGSPTSDSLPLSLLSRLARPGAVSSIAQVQPTPARLFGRARADAGTLHMLILAVVAPGPSRTRAIHPVDVAARMVASQAYERRRLMDAYAAFRYAFPERRNLILESAAERELALLSRTFRDIPAHELLHPYPVDLSEIRDAILPVLRTP